MKEENNGVTQNKWKRLIKKKWFFPAVYLTVAALLLAGVVWYQNVDNQIPEVEDGQELGETADDYTPNPYDEDAEPVMEQQEIIQMPVEDQDQAEIVTKFYDYNSDQEDQEAALVLYNNRYYQSTGVDIVSSDGEAFDVTASLSGSVAEVKEDPLLGNVVSLDHGNEVVTYYASLGEVNVEKGQEVEQGEAIGTAGKNIFGQDNGNHVHFELRKDGKEYNPEDFFNQSVTVLDDVAAEEDSEDASESSSMTPAGDSDVDAPTDGVEESDPVEEEDPTEETDPDEEEDEESGEDADSDNDDDATDDEMDPSENE
ncbi:M23 family metallopeptidase [Oceanobacillus halotolerans]|uniref:M23 family metallopeptidase n=1 Tax=Oceanobacillus halotolerans TaxID=2663380 RepID=UPI0013D9C45B|nr:M23 family metallopeptidase [Oceanobacillus halotolerans]